MKRNSKGHFDEDTCVYYSGGVWVRPMQILLQPLSEDLPGGCTGQSVRSPGLPNQAFPLDLELE